ncbi:hypothetical protein LAA29_130311 [Leuconostoc carnosum]|nr:hypothetical protein LCAC16_150386 [Leuconostoc carnosum]SPO33567.1 hypothetical protein LAA29_130311 [Leuconostoc carnosum]
MMSLKYINLLLVRLNASTNDTMILFFLQISLISQQQFYEQY